MLDADAVALLRIADALAQLPPVLRRIGIGGDAKLRNVCAETLDRAAQRIVQRALQYVTRLDQQIIFILPGKRFGSS